MNKYREALKRLKENNYLIYDSYLKDLALIEEALNELENMSLIQKNKQLENELEELAKTKIDFVDEIDKD